MNIDEKQLNHSNVDSLKRLLAFINKVDPSCYDGQSKEQLVRKLKYAVKPVKVGIY